MSDTRSRAIAYLKEKHGIGSNKCIYTSRYYPADLSATRGPSWWHEIPVKVIKDNIVQEIHLICETEKMGFYCLRVPTEFLKDNLNRLSIGKNGKVGIFLSAVEKDMFVDYKSKARIDFSKWMLKE